VVLYILIWALLQPVSSKQGQDIELYEQWPNCDQVDVACSDGEAPGPDGGHSDFSLCGDESGYASSGSSLYKLKLFVGNVEKIYTSTILASLGAADCRVCSAPTSNRICEITST